MTIATISASEFVQKLADKPTSIRIDVRTAAEFEGVNCVGSRNLPLQAITKEQVTDYVASTGGDQTSEIFLICQAGKRAQMAAEQLSGKLSNPLIVVEGGVQALPAACLQSSGRKVISLERQVRIAAGCLVLIGVLLGSFVDPLGYYLSAFVGAGLTFAGITDTCAMGLMLARMPWNRASNP